MELIELIKESNVFLEQSILFQGARFILGVILVVLVLDILLLLYMLIIKDKYYRSFTLGHGIPNIVNTMNHRWRRVLRMVKSSDVRQQQEAVIEAGNMLYEILEDIKYEGGSLDEMLDNMVGPQLANIEELKRASQIKNMMVNDSDYKLSNEVALETVKAFGEALFEQEAIKELGL